MHDIEVSRSAPPAPTALSTPLHAVPSHPAAATATRDLAAALLVKRLIDVVIASVAMILLAPFMALVALAIRLDSPGPIVFKQRRLGRDGAPFVFLKFRTMVDGNDPSIHREYVTQYMTDCSDELKGDNGSFKIEHDPRVTRIGRLLRRSSMDELPQLLNVLRGEMSIVGPRPPLEYEADLYTRRQRHRLDVLPGMTGLWQVSGRCETTFDEMIDLDLKYVDTWTVGMDLKIIARTASAIVDRKGAW
jgi:lipopolysaccharide/colanic/teichoic acid biosynthesis glycosyltransferase